MRERCIQCDHKIKDHSTNFDGEFVEVECENCYCHGFIGIDKLLTF